MNKKPSSCAICEQSNRTSICSNCVNCRLSKYHNLLKLLRGRRDQLYSTLSEVLVAKGKADDQNNWRVIQNEKLASLEEKLHQSKEQLVRGRTKIERMSYDLKVKYGVLDSVHAVLQKNRVEQLEKFYPNLICTQSLGHMAITSELLHKQSVVMKQICKLFPQLQKNPSDYSLPNLAASFLYATEISGVVENESVFDGWDLVEHPTFPPPPSQTEDVEHWTRNPAASFLYVTEISDVVKNESIFDGWDLVEHCTFPPPPSQTEDVERWTRAMFIDAIKK